VFIQSGLYLDFFIKKCGEVFLKNFMVLTPQFFGEKYFIEVLTRRTIERFLTNFNKLVGLTSLGFFNFFYIFFILLFNLISLFNLIFIFI
jgi:hypothetical protein